MPRKSNKKVEEKIEATVEAKSEATKKKVSKKEEPVFTIGEMIKWTDEECKAQDKKLKFKVIDVRNILQSLVSVNDRLSDTTYKLNILKSSLSQGLMTGYKIKCPHCQREYIVNSMELNRTDNIMCKVCGTEYKEVENINGISLFSDDDEVMEI